MSNGILSPGSRRPLLLSLILLTLVVGGIGIYIGLSQNSTTTELPETGLVACGNQDYVCTNDSQCVSKTNYKLLRTCDANGANCIDDLKTDATMPAECDQKTNSQNNRCALTDSACPSGYKKFTEEVNGTPWCGCKRNVATSTPTSTPTATVIVTHPVTTGTKIPVTTIVPTALINDEADRIIIGAALFLFGIIFFNLNLHEKLGNLFWNLIFPKTKDAAMEPITRGTYTRERDEFENKF